MNPASEAIFQERASMFATDFDALRVGDIYESPPREIGSRDVAMFAALTGDHHPVHFDPEWAARGPFGGLIAHGLLVLSCAAGSLPFDPDRILALRRIGDAVFKRPLAVGDSIRVRSTIIELRPLDERTGLVSCEWRITGGDGRLRARASAEVLWRRAESTAAEEGGSPSESEPIWAAALAPQASSRFDPELAPVVVTDDGVRVLF